MNNTLSEKRTILSISRVVILAFFNFFFDVILLNGDIFGQYILGVLLYFPICRIFFETWRVCKSPNLELFASRYCGYTYGCGRLIT